MTTEITKLSDEELLEEALNAAARLCLIRNDVQLEADTCTEEEAARDAAWACFGEGTCSPDPIPEVTEILKRMAIPAAQPQESFWVIERFEDDKSKGYWAGDSSRDFIADIEDAIHFCRRDDAWRIKRGWHWGDTKITEHVMIPSQKEEE